MRVSDPNMPNLRELTLPARDIARGLKHTLAQARSFAPIRAAVPGPLRGLVSDLAGLARSAHHVVGRLRRGSYRRVVALSEIEQGRDPALHFAAVAQDGLELVLARMGRDDMLVSETVAAVAYRAAQAGAGADDGPAERAAHLALSLAQHHAAAPFPGTAIGMGREDARLVLTAAVAVLLWMMLDRDADRENEDMLLALCGDLAQSLDSEIEAAGQDPARLAALIASYAAMV